MANSLLGSFRRHLKAGTLRTKFHPSTFSSGFREHLSTGTLLRPRRLATTPDDCAQGVSARRLNLIHHGMPSCTTYLEVGVQLGLTFEHVSVPFRWGVDPDLKFDTSKLPPGVRVSPETSDDFFARLDAQHMFDLIFLDGLHEWRQTYRDLLNALKHSPPHGLILIDDVVPDDEWSAIPDHSMSQQSKKLAGVSHGNWQGDVFKVILAIVDRHPELDFRVIGFKDGGAQALVWRKPPSSFQPEDSSTGGIVHDYLDVSYADVFTPGELPSEFRPAAEQDGLSEALAASALTWTRHHATDTATINRSTDFAVLDG